MLYLGVDVGGSGIKGALVDLDNGEFASERIRIETPGDFGREGVLDTIAEVAAAHDHTGPIGVGFPGVVRRGVVMSPPTAHEVEGWVGHDVAGELAERHGAAVTMVNDADAAGVAEVRYGAGAGVDGLVMVFTLGTGVGSAVFLDGVLQPNTELGKLYLRNDKRVVEHHVSDRIRDEDDLDWDEYGARLHEFLSHVDRLFTPDLVILGGGVSKKADKYVDQIDIRCDVVPAALRNQAGIVGAAAAATSTVQ